MLQLSDKWAERSIGDLSEGLAAEPLGWLTANKLQWYIEILLSDAMIPALPVPQPEAARSAP